MPLGAAKIAYQGYQVAAAVGRTAQPITVYNDAQVDTAQYQFTGGSLLLDGTGDGLKLDTGADLTVYEGTGDFTYECWVRFATAPVANQTFFDLRGTSAGATSIVFFAKNNQLSVYQGSRADYSCSLTTGVWYHVALCRSGSNYEVFLDGTSLGTATFSSGSLVCNGFNIGIYGDGSTNPFNGHIDEIRVSDTVRYTTTFTPSTSPFTNDSNTILLIHANGTDGSTAFTDDVGSRSPAGIGAVNDSQVDTAQSKFGGASALFDGTNDYLDVFLGDPIVGGDFTLEAWVRNDGTWSSTNEVVFNPYAGASSSTTFIGSMAIYNGYIATWRGGWSVGTTNQLSNNTWHHVSWTRDSGTVYCHVDGQFVTSRGNTAGSTGLGYTSISSTNGDFGGHIDEIRITEGNRYGVTTGNYTAPTAAFVNDADTRALIHCDGTDASTDFPDDNS